MLFAIILTAAACTRIHAVCDPLAAYEAAEQQRTVYLQCLQQALTLPEETAKCIPPPNVVRPAADLDDLRRQCDRVIPICKEQGLW